MLGLAPTGEGVLVWGLQGLRVRVHGVRRGFRVTVFRFLDLVCMVEVFDKPCRISEYGILVRGLGLSGAFRISTEIEPIKPLLVIFDWCLGLWGDSSKQTSKLLTEILKL